jgi:hypothetical protein
MREGFFTPSGSRQIEIEGTDRLMPRSKIPAHLVHKIGDVHKDAELMNWLCSIVTRNSVPIVYEALKRETSSTIADAWIETARSVLNEILADERLKNLQSIEEPKSSLAAHLNSEMLRPDEEEAEEIAHEVARSLVGSWLEVLRQNTLPDRWLLLTDTLVPAQREGEAWRSLFESVSATPLEPKEIREIVAATRDEMFKERSTVELPLGILIAHEWPANLTSKSLGVGHYYAKGTRLFWDLARRNSPSFPH